MMRERGREEEGWEKETHKSIAKINNNPIKSEQRTFLERSHANGY